MSLTKKIESLILSKMVSEKERKVGIEVEGLYYDKRLNQGFKQNPLVLYFPKRT